MLLRPRFPSVALSFLFAAFAFGFDVDAATPRQTSENKRFLVTESNAPFFWLGDTAWEKDPDIKKLK